MSDRTAPPATKRVESRREFHGDVFVDPYEWLRDKSSPDVIAHLEAENEYADQSTAQLEPLRQRIFDEIKARTKETDLSGPSRFPTRRPAGCSSGRSARWPNFPSKRWSTTSGKWAPISGDWLTERMFAKSFPTAMPSRSAAKRRSPTTSTIARR